MQINKINRSIRRNTDANAKLNDIYVIPLKVPETTF